MHFKDVLSDVEKLVGKRLQSLNPKTQPIYITKIDTDSKKYFVSSNPDEQGSPRFFWELEAIWSDLTQKGFCNVDQSLFGSGSSRNQPETIFANLPYIQYFRFKGKKHIFLRGTPIHEFGTLSELAGDELSSILSKIDNYFALSNQDISSRQRKVLNSLEAIQSRIDSGSFSASIGRELELAIKALSSLEQDVNESIVTLKNEPQRITSESVEEIRKLEVKPVEDLIEDESFTGVENEEESSADDESNENKASHEERSNSGLRIRHITPVLTLIYDRLSFKEIELQPDFQRQDRIWSMEKRAKLIESILMGLPLPAFYFAEKKDGDWIVVDGLQRITTVFDFMKDYFRLEKLENVDDSYNGKLFSELSRLDKRKIREYQITAHVIDSESDKENLIVELFHRINTYGVKLSNQEIRSAMYQGSSVTFLRHLSSSREFLAATNGRVRAQRQKDMELCLSAISYIALGYKDYDYSLYTDFLSDAMKKVNEFPLFIDNKDEIDQGFSTVSPNSAAIFHQLESRFKQGLNLAHKVFDGVAFKKSLGAGKSAPISKPLFEVIVTVFSNLTPKQCELVASNADELIANLYNAIESDSIKYARWESDKYEDANRGFMYSISVSTGKRPTILYRFDAFKNILKESTGIETKIVPVLGNKNDK
ncbi:DUF262 domain-containing protein [Vibrio alginolyticus]|uniref:DUF262 domain-containing protein n=1 Tax=Vibrio parahaemolyticus TaxID=670 RepID=UPI001120F12B|nr:DUF262 domain-containing protein [Vibrio parahaemolyticus]EHV9720174.1 DUF262 domain-containing protein [Vibrio parahaemolyticus]EID7698070.1 DUF262 domain-containing protein [Vibrio parahaemolyticus]EIU6781261.1 DUF262 domain-containing protein [Vibrio parahaemolyticus]EJG1426095.1 DUF262 domain-containing protein [Vibrio parahaemolyticus]MBE4455697.1 DUF262 domain-containing protein [Vibrio parahaemolyticus]